MILQRAVFSIQVVDLTAFADPFYIMLCLAILCNWCNALIPYFLAAAFAN